MQPPRFPAAITNSMVKDFHSCPFKWYTTYCNRMAPLDLSIHLAAGGAFAAGLAAARLAFYEQALPAPEAVLAGVRALLAAWPFDDLRSSSRKPLPVVILALVDYLEQYPFGEDLLQPAFFHDGRRGIEFSFDDPLPIDHPTTGEPLLYFGRADMLATFSGEHLVITDEKTTTQIGPQWASRFTLSGQFLGYLWAIRARDYGALGVCVRGIGLRKDRTEIAQTILMPSKELVADWYESLLSTVKDMLAVWERQTARRVYADACSSYGGCHLQNVCYHSKAAEDLTEADGFTQVDKLYFERDR